MTIAQLVRDIKALKVQGAEHVALSAVQAINHMLSSGRVSSFASLRQRLLADRKLLEAARPTEPFLRNVLSYIFHGFEETTLEEMQARVRSIILHFSRGDQRIVAYGVPLLRGKEAAYTHCHSSTVVAVLKAAHAQGMRFTVRNTETRPLYQGRTTAAELAAAGVPVIHFVDSAMRYALKQCDIALLGCDAITPTKIINKIGSELACEVAHRRRIPVYICTNSWKLDPHTLFGYDEEIERRSSEEVWSAAPKGIKIDNYAFENIDSRLVTGIVSELGVHPPRQFIRAALKEYPFLKAFGKRQKSPIRP
ncbi:translation initiation factor eIF-2B [Candidatus Woesearchaeota archaeon]|nr:translation initiation factor eIF-2B [Candidatus Woesearchaeota archaeon]